MSVHDINIDRAIATVSERRREISLKPEGKLGNQAMDHPTRTQKNSGPVVDSGPPPNDYWVLNRPARADFPGRNRGDGLSATQKEIQRCAS
jgi:hypothetical protein